MGLPLAALFLAMGPLRHRLPALVLAFDIAFTLVLASGCQAEERSAFGRIAAGAHGHVRLEPQDRVILSARRIPGNFFTATPRAGNRLTEAADLLIADTVDGKSVARYARVRFCAAD